MQAECEKNILVCTSVERSSSCAAIADPIATATAAEAATRPCLSRGSSRSAGRTRKSGAATGRTYSQGNTPDFPYTAPNRHPVQTYTHTSTQVQSLRGSYTNVDTHQVLHPKPQMSHAKHINRSHLGKSYDIQLK